MNLDDTYTIETVEYSRLTLSNPLSQNSDWNTVATYLPNRLGVNNNVYTGSPSIQPPTKYLFGNSLDPGDNRASVLFEEVSTDTTPGPFIIQDAENVI